MNSTKLGIIWITNGMERGTFGGIQINPSLYHRFWPTPKLKNTSDHSGDLKQVRYGVVLKWGKPPNL